MTTPGLNAALTQAATIQGVLAKRDHAHQAATATAAAAKIRDLVPGSVTITVTVRHTITSTHWRRPGKANRMHHRRR